MYLNVCYSPAVSKDANTKDAGYAAVTGRDFMKLLESFLEMLHIFLLYIKLTYGCLSCPNDAGYDPVAGRAFKKQMKMFLKMLNMLL
jgi:hypothetical protein